MVASPELIPVPVAPVLCPNKIKMKGLEKLKTPVMPISLEQKNLLRSYLTQGLLRGFYAKDLKTLTASEADFFIQCAEDNRWKTGKSLSAYYQRTEMDIAPAKTEQLRKIIHLIRDGFLRCISLDSLLKICNLTARRLIWMGEINKRRGKKCF